uniref:P-type ATPase A domain-containing protein n=1 Tax=Lactuca sativa TaxID=4236 RepID=A0A9R1X2H1_LACSA|nr:hypothetical protein LSAT_V11C700372160 [Lactuca sativa]
MFVTMRERECVCVCVIHLMIGDQVPAYWIFISGYSLSIDESSMTGESHTIRLSACEMMGSATTICCDKTGTLNSNLWDIFLFLMTGRGLYLWEEK